jgi:hypothetical protein
MDDRSLSTYARNVKLIAGQGSVTLKGVVRTGEERPALREKAEQVAGAGKAADDRSVRPKTKELWSERASQERTRLYSELRHVRCHRTALLRLLLLVLSERKFVPGRG